MKLNFNIELVFDEVINQQDNKGLEDYNPFPSKAAALVYFLTNSLKPIVCPTLIVLSHGH